MYSSMISAFDDREEFARILHANVSPTSPIQSQEHLYGREKQVRGIDVDKGFRITEDRSSDSRTEFVRTTPFNSPDLV
jgi:hypothetical protein